MPNPESILADLKTRTQAEPDLLASVEIGADADAAGWYNAAPGSEPAIVTRFATKRTIYADLGISAGLTILEKIRAVIANENADAGLRAVLTEAMSMIDTDGSEGQGLDFGLAETRTQIDVLVGAGVLTSEEGAALKGIAERPQSLAEELFGGAIVAHDVSDALRSVRVDGTATLAEGWQS